MEIKRILLTVALFMGLLSRLPAQEPYLPEPSGQVVSDYENLLNEEQKRQLAGVIKESYNKSSNQLMIVCIPTHFTGSLTIEDYAHQLFIKWQPGQKGLNNGVLMLISGSQTDSVNRKLRFEVGYGLEGALPDLLCKKIQMELMVPKLKEHKYYDAILSGTQAILSAISKENAGRTPVFRFKVKNEPVLKDQVGLLSAAEFTGLAAALKPVVRDESEAVTISLNESGYSYGENYVSLSERWNNYPFLSLTFQNPYELTQYDSTVQIARPDKPKGVSLTGYCLTGQSEEEQAALKKQLTALLSEGKYAEAIQACITSYTNVQEARMRLFYGWIIAQIFLTLAACIVFYRARSYLRRKSQQLFYKGSSGYVWLTVVVILVGIVVWPGVVTFEIPQMSFWMLLVDGLPTYMLWITGAVLLITHFTGIVFSMKISGLKESRKTSRRSGSYGSYSSSSDYSSSSYSSSSSDDSYSSSSSSSGDSNSDYGGGGGDSGGGGSSSDW